MGEVYTVAAFSRVLVPAAVAGVPGSATGSFEWPRAGKCSGILLVPHSGTEADLASLALSILDEDGRQMVSDLGRSVPSLEVQPHAVPCLSLFGTEFLPMKLQRVIKRSGEVWTFEILNASALAVRVASLGLLFEG